MMGSTPTALAPYSDLVNLLKLIADPDGLKKTLAALQAAHDQAKTEIDAYQAASMTALNAKAAEVETLRQSVADLQTRQQKDREDLDVQAGLLRQRETAVKDGEAALARGTDQHDALSKELADKQAALAAAESAFAQVKAATEEQMRSQIAAYDAQAAALAEAQTKLDANTKSRMDALRNAQTKLDADTAAIEERERLVAAREEATAALQKEAETKLASLQNFASSLKT